MPRPRKLHFHNTTLFVSASLEEGILLLPNPLLNSIIRSSLARAQTLHPMTISHFLVEGTHVHFIAVVNNPNDIKGFMERFKTESAHCINRLLGRKKRTVWCEGYDSPILLTVDDVMRKIAYIYTNPAKDNLERTIDHYPGLSSWNMFIGESFERKWAWIRRPAVPSIKAQTLRPEDYKALAEELIAGANTKCTFRIEPNAWMECFGIDSPEEQAKLNQRIKQRIKAEESDYEKARQVSGKGVMGRERLLRQQLDTSYRPERSGKRMWCICSDRTLRKRFISYVKELIQQAREVYRRWQMGDYRLSFPLGLYPPSKPKVAESLVLSY